MATLRSSGKAHRDSSGEEAIGERYSDSTGDDSRTGAKNNCVGSDMPVKKNPPKGFDQVVSNSFIHMVISFLGAALLVLASALVLDLGDERVERVFKWACLMLVLFGLATLPNASPYLAASLRDAFKKITAGGLEFRLMGMKFKIGLPSKTLDKKTENDD